MNKMLCIIPARGGSKRLPRKNIRDFLGKPLIAWAIDVAKASQVFERIIVFTDDNEIAAIAEKYDAEIPFMEPTELAQDGVYTGDAVRYALQKLSDNERYEPRNCFLIEPSCVGQTPTMIREAAEIFQNKTTADSLVGISETPKHFDSSKQLILDKDTLVSRISDGAVMKKLSHMDHLIGQSYFINSALYAFRRKNLFEQDKNLWGNSTYGFVINRTLIEDIDTEEDWVIAEAKMKYFQKERYIAKA